MIRSSPRRRLLALMNRRRWLTRVPVAFLYAGVPLAPKLEAKLRRAEAWGCEEAQCHIDLIRESLAL